MTPAGLRPLDFTQPYLDSRVDLHLALGVRVRAWLLVHGRSLAVLGVLLPLVALLHGWNMFRSPGITLNDDEGTYVSQAWAVENWHQLGHYTYWYDHPPLGWIQMAGYAWATDAWARAPYSVAVGREFMLVVNVLACALLYVLARRLSFRRWAAAAAVVLFAASPLGLHHHRMVWLDNIGVLWTVAALVLAASPRRSLGSALGSGGCMAIAVLSKETLLLLAPIVFWVLWQHSDVRTRRYRLVAYSLVTGTLACFYPLYALVKSELLEGPGHVSLLWAVRWQLTLRPSNGSIFDPDSGARSYFEGWVRLDSWLVGTAVALALPALWVWRLRPLAVGLMLLVALLLRPGYLPSAYVVAVLPFAALLVAGCADHTWRLRAPWLSRRASRPLLILPFVTGALAVAPEWARGNAVQLTSGSEPAPTEAVAWVKANVGPGKHIVTDGNVWLDLVRAGYDPRAPHWAVTWVYKVGTDPSVKIHRIDYFVYAMDPIYGARESPSIVAPYRHSRVVATFGSGDNRITVREVVREAARLQKAPG